MRAWRNWSGTARCRPARIAMPTDEAGLVAAVAAAGRDGLPIRAAGTGHSFNPLATTDGLLLEGGVAGEWVVYGAVAQRAVVCDGDWG